MSEYINPYEKYIICPACHIGGYDFCPECAGGGGYSISTNDKPNKDVEKIKKSRLNEINDQLELIVINDLDNEKIEKRLQEYLLELSAIINNTEVNQTFERIIKLRQRQALKRLRKKINSLNNVQRVYVDYNGKCNLHNNFWTINQLVFNPNESRHIPFENEYFGYKNNVGIVIKVNNSLWVNLSSKLLDDLMGKLESLQLMDFNSPSLPENLSFIQELKYEEFQKRVIKLDYYNNQIELSFLIERIRIVQMLQDFTNHLRSNGLQGWQEVKATNDKLFP